LVRRAKHKQCKQQNSKSEAKTLAREKRPSQQGDTNHDVENSDAPHVFDICHWGQITFSNTRFHPMAATEEIGLPQIKNADPGFQKLCEEKQP